MTVFGVSMVRNERDVIAQTVRHMAWHVDAMIIIDNGSTDGTRDVLRDLSMKLPLTVIDDPDLAYYQSAKMTRLAEQAAEQGATWIVPFDADELWNPFDEGSGQRVADVLSAADCDVAEAALYDYRATALDPAGDDPFLTMQWRTRKPAMLPKVAFRWSAGSQIHQGNHGVTIGDGESVPVVHRLLAIGHFPYRSAEQFVRKAVQGGKAYAATDLPESQGKHWRDYYQLYQTYGADVLEDVFREYFWALSPIDAGLVHHPVSYQGRL